MREIPRKSHGHNWPRLLHATALGAIALLTGVLAGLTALAILGWAPWLQIRLAYGDTPLPHAGIYVQTGLTLFAVALSFFLPANRRIMALEQSHRNFHIAMQDVAQAYRAAHEADRANAFQMHSEFDAVRERLAFLRNHPDFGGLEPGILELAAQMSTEASELAEVYSDEKVIRARAFLRQRQQEIDATEQALEQARDTCRDLKEWLSRLDAEDAVQRRKIQALEEDLLALLPQLGFETQIETMPAKPENVVPLTGRGGS